MVRFDGLKLFLMAGFAWFASPLKADQSLTVTVTKGFGIELYASGFEDAKQLAVGDRGTLFVGTGKAGTINALVDANNDGRSDRHYVLDKGLTNPEAIAFHQGALYVASDDKILKFEDIEQRLRRPGRPKVVYEGLPAKTSKGARTMAFGPDGRLYLSLGAPCNVCESDAPHSSILAIDLATGASEQVAVGIRASLGFDWSPHDGKLWFADMGRNWMGDNIPPDEINRVESVGRHYGFPYVHGKNVLEPAYNKPQQLNVAEPVYELPAHVSPAGLLFYRGTQFPEAYQGQLLVAENGSWNRSSKVGYQVVTLRLNEQGEVVGRDTLFSFLDGEFPVGRPYGLAMAPDGSLFISDDFKGNVYRAFYRQDASDSLANDLQNQEEQP